MLRRGKKIISCVFAFSSMHANVGVSGDLTEYVGIKKNYICCKNYKGENERESKHISGAFAVGRNLFLKNQSKQKLKLH